MNALRLIRSLLSIVAFSLLLSTADLIAGTAILRKFDSASPLEGLKISTFAGEASASADPVVPSDEIIIGLLTETLLPADAVSLKTKLAPLFVSGKQHNNVRVIAYDGIEVTRLGPFTSRSQFLSAIQKVIAKIPTEPPDTTSAAADVYGLLEKVTPIDARPWSSMLIVGRLLEPEPQISAYLRAYLAWMFRDRRLRTSYWSPGGDRCETLEQASRETAAPVAPLEPAEILTGLASESAYFAEIVWPEPQLKAGFHLYEAALKDSAGEFLGLYTSIATASDQTLPAPALFQELRSNAAALTELARASGGADTTLDQDQDAIKRALAINPRDDETLRSGASILERRGDLKDASALLESLAEIHPLDASLFTELGDVLFRSQDLDRAESPLLRARELGATKPFVSEELGRIAVSKGRFREALPYLEDYLAQDPRNGTVWFLRADCSLQISDSERTIDSLEHGLNLEPEQLAYRTRLIQLYLSRGEGNKALPHARFVVHNPPDDAEVRATYSLILEKIGTPDEALDMWRQTLAIAPGMERAHIAVVQLLAARGDLPAAAASAEAGIGQCPTSARLYLLKADAEDRQGMWQRSRSTLQAGVGSTEDLELLRHYAIVEDQYGLKAAEAYDKLAIFLKKSGQPQSELVPVLDRGLFVAVRDGEMDRAERFAELLRESGQPQRADWIFSRAGKTISDVLVPGGIAAALRVIGGRESIKPGDYFLELAQVVSASSNDQATAQALRNRVAEHFNRTRQIEALGARKGDQVVLHLSVRDRNALRTTERILSLLGWNLQSSNAGVRIEPAERGSAAKRQITSAALALDEIAMQEALQSGRDFELIVRDGRVPVILGEAQWREAFVGSASPDGGLSEVFSANPRLARLYIGIEKLDDATAAGLVRDFGLKTLAEKYTELLYYYSASLVVQDGRVVLPGGATAEPVWQQLVGSKPAVPRQFLSSLLRRDDGRLLAFYALLMQLDFARQKFFTASRVRAARFYELFKDSPDLHFGALVHRRSMAFSDFMRQLPLDEAGHVLFPGSPEVWMVAKGQSSSVSGTAGLLREVSRVTAPDVEDQILLRLARTAYSSDHAELSELDNFLAVEHLDAHRSEPLDEASALLLAQHYARHRQAWPYLVTLGGLQLDDYSRFFRLSEDLLSLDHLLRNEVLGEFNALLKILCLLHESGRIDQEHATILFRGICDKFQKGRESADFAAASMDLIAELIETGKGAGTNADEAIRDALLEHGPPVSFVFNGKTRIVSGPEEQSAAFREVLDLQKVPALASLLDLYRLTREISVSKGVPAELASAVEAAVAHLPEVAVPKSLKLEGTAEKIRSDCMLSQVREITASLRKAASKKKPDRKKMTSLSHELLAALNPQVRLALTGIIYAYYMSPRDLLISDDPLFLRKHQFLKFGTQIKAESIWEVPDLMNGTKGGSYLVGGLADFS
ncbi:MAG: tetratricopeptide repeat protein, partial [Acidobacteriota bacterium]